MSSLRGTKQTKAIQSNPALRGKNTSKLNQYKYQNQTAIDTINKYNELMNSGGWMSADDLTKYNSAIETYKTTGTALRDASKFYGTKYTEEEEKGWLDSLASLSNSYTSANELYSSFADADQFTNWWNYNTGKNEYHSVTGAEDYLQNSQYVKGGQDSRYDFINQGKGYSVPIAGMGADDLVAGFTSWLPDPARDAIGSALGYSEPLPDVDYSEFISDFFTGLVKGNPDAAMYTNNGDLELTDEEIGVYNYYYATQGKEKAEEYLKFIEEEIRQRKAGIDYANFKAADKLMDALLKTDTGNLGEYVYGYGAGVESGLAGLANMNALVKGTEGYTPASQYVSSMIRNDLGGKNGELTLEQVFYDLANTTGNMTPSLVVGGAAGPLAGAITMGLSSAGNNYTSFLKENYGVDAARAYGIITGVSEAGMSYLFSGIGKLGGKLTSKLAGNIASGLNNAAARIAVDFGKSFIGEAFEEAAQTALEPVFKWAATLGEAELEAINWEEVGYSALLGGLSGGMLEGVPSLVQTGLQSHAAYTNAGGSTFGGVVDALINPDVDFTEYVTQNAQNVTDTAVDYANELESIDPGNKAAQYVLKKAEAGKNISGYQINRLANEINSTNQEAVKSAVKTRLVELGEGVMAGKVADVITKVQLGQAITSAEEAILNTSKNAYLVLTESDVSNIKGGGLANKWSESILKNLDSKNGGKKVKTPIAVRPEEEKESVGVNAEDSGKRVDSGITAVEIDGDNAVFTLANGEKVSADKMEYASDNHREVANIAMERTTRVPGFTAEVASAMIKGYDGASSVSDYSAAINDAYRYGYQGIPMAEISTGKNTSLIKNKTALYTAYDAGKQYAKSATTRPAFVGTKGKDAKGSVTIDKKIDQSKLTKEQRQQIKALDIIANALGINITVFESPVNAQGQHIGINGKYNTETHSIEIDLHAGADGRGVMLFTASHELTHHIRNVAADKFKVFADAVFEEIGKTGRSVDALIEKRVEEMRGKKDYKGLSEEKLYDKAYEEVVADAAESMLTDSDALARLSEKIKGKDKNLWDTIKSFFNDLVKEIKALYRQFNPDSLEGSLVRDMGDAAERLQNLWVEGLMEASEAGTEISAEEETMVSLDTKSESVSPEMFSERTWTASEYVTAREEMANKIANALGVSVRKAKKYIDDVNSIAKLIANDRARLDYEASSFGSAFVSNEMLDEYEGGHAQYPVAHGVVDKFVSEYEGNVKYQERISVDDAFSNRALLANALSSTVKSDAEADLLESYKKKIGELNSMNEELSAVQTQIDTLMKTVKIGNEKMSYATFQKQARQQAKKIGLSTENLEFGKRDNNYVATINGDVILKAERVIRTKAQNERLHELQNIAKELEQEITKKDKKLLELEATKALKDVVERERQQAYKAAAEKGREALRRNVGGRHKSEARAKIKGLKEKFMGMLEHPTERQYVPSDLVSAMVKVCELVDTSTALIKSNGEINKAQQARNEQMQRLINLAAEYKKIKNNPDAMIAEEYEAEIADYLDEIVANYASKNIADMTLDELNELYRTMKAIEETLRDARKLIGWTDAESVYDAGDSIIEEQRGIAATRKQNGITRADDVVVNMSLSPMRAVLRMGGYNEDSALYRAMRDIERGTREQKKFVMDAVKKFESLTTGKNADVYEKAIYDPYGKELVDKNGKKFHVTKMQMMQAVMSYEREMANEKLHHVSNGGFTFADIDLLGKGEIREAVSAKNAHTVTLGAELALQFQMELANDQWAQDYMAEARRFFDETAKDAINEANMKLKHRIIATGKNYIPYEVNSDYIVREITSENDIQQVISGYGMLKDLKAGATQPIIITGLNNVLDRHIEQVGNVAALAVPIRNFNKIWNVKAADGSTTVKEAISNNWGTRGTDLITQAVKDVQGSRIQDRSDLYKAYKVVKSNIIGATFLGNVSVVLKQVGSMYTATSMLGWRNPVSMIGNLFATKANRDAIAAEVNKYTAVAWIRGQGLSDAELYELKTAKKKSKIGRAIDKLPNAVKATSWITQMDYDVALSLWKYAKEDVAKRTGLEGEELLQATAEYYNDVIENTQSMSDALHRPEIQKSDNIASETLGIFKTDLYQSAGLLRVAVENVKANPGKESNKALVKALGGTFMSMCWGSLITSLMAALRYKPDRYRDDEDDEITLGSWLKVAAGDMVEEMFGYAFPLFGSEAAGIISAFINGESYEFDNLTLDAVNDLLKAFTSVGATFNEEDFFSEKAGKAWKNLLIKAAAVFGVPANNVTRFIDAVRLHAQDIANGEFLSFEAGLTSKNPTRLYNAYIDGDADKIEKASRNYEDEKAVNEALRLQLRERDPRMQEIAQCELLGDTKRSVALEKDIVAEGHFDKDEVVGKAINAEINYVKEKLKDLKTAQKEGKTEDAEAIIKALIKRGYTQAFIDAYLKKIS